MSFRTVNISSGHALASILTALACIILTTHSIGASNDNNSNKRSTFLADDFSKAFDHGARVRSEGACHTPHPTIVYVNTTDPSKVYLPRGTVLHRCSDLTGCCQHPSETCEAIEMQTVELYFITLTLQVQNQHRNRRVRQSPKVEKILFTNHTQCGCRERNTNDIGYDMYNDLK